MKKFLLLLTASVVFTLVGCSDTEETDTAKQKEVEKEETTPQLSKEEYEVKTIELTNGHFATVQELAEKRSNTSTIGQSELDWFDDKLNELTAQGEEIQSLNPPKEYQELDTYLEEFVNEFAIYIDGFKSDLETQNAGLGSDYLDHAQKAQDYYNYVRAIIALEYDYVVGTDGTITVSDLKSLDLNIGKDKDSVLLNVSRDGKELIGQWGFYNEDGSFNVSIELNEDGSYAGYGNGTYPAKENYFAGSWEYHFLTQTIVFKHTETVIDGKEAESRRTMTMELQSFQPGELQMQDIETLNTFRYKKNDGTSQPVKDEQAAEKTTTKEKEKTNVGSNKTELIGFWSNTEADTLSINLSENGQATTFLPDMFLGYWEYDATSDSIAILSEEGAEVDAYDIIEMTDKDLTLEIDGKTIEFTRMY